MPATIKNRVPEPAPARVRPGAAIFTGLAGIFLFVAVLKFGDPVILNNLLPPPSSMAEVIYESWPVQWGFVLALGLAVAGLAVIPWKSLRFKWPMALPAIWLGWQFISATQTISRHLTIPTLEHFSVCVGLFYLGCFALQGVSNPWPIWAGLGLALCCFLRNGFEQHFGGLEATRHFIETLKNNPSLPQEMANNPEYQRRIASNRIFASFCTADAMAGGIELLLPVSLVFVWQITPKVRTSARWLFAGILGACALAAMYWTGSKGGWMVTVIVGAVALGRSPLTNRQKILIGCALVAIGTAAIGLRYATAPQKQQASINTRKAYWEGALQIAVGHPVFGTGPGTFSVLYGRINAELKRSSEYFARLAHNDYLEQASDSGFPGFLAYAMMIFGCLIFLYRYRFRNSKGFDSFFAVWIGVLAICLHSFVEYHLYIPALSWPMFFLIGFCMKS